MIFFFGYLALLFYVSLDLWQYFTKRKVCFGFSFAGRCFRAKKIKNSAAENIKLNELLMKPNNASENCANEKLNAISDS